MEIDLYWFEQKGNPGTMCTIWDRFQPLYEGVEGYLDIFAHQTWAGAWNEVGLRQESFWSRPTLGWTYQLGNTLLHADFLSLKGWYSQHVIYS